MGITRRTWQPSCATQPKAGFAKDMPMVDGVPGWQWVVENLYIVPPAQDTYEPLYSMRLAIESTELKNLTSLHIEPLSIAGLTPLHWGGFDAFTDSSWVGQSYWRGIKDLRIGMKTDWPLYAHTVHREDEEEDSNNDGESDSGTGC
ncbi:MAG: hypothetical protein Q9208_006546 [Pyrenodesmia sp. 3 TL-2023]